MQTGVVINKKGITFFEISIPFQYKPEWLLIKTVGTFSIPNRSSAPEGQDSVKFWLTNFAPPSFSDAPCYVTQISRESPKRVKGTPGDAESWPPASNKEALKFGTTKLTTNSLRCWRWGQGYESGKYQNIFSFNGLTSWKHWGVFYYLTRDFTQLLEYTFTHSLCGGVWKARRLHHCR